MPICQDGNKKFVTKEDFSIAYDRPVIECYKKKYGDNWQEIYEKCRDGKLLLSLHDDSNISSNYRYQPETDFAQQIIGLTKSNI